MRKSAASLLSVAILGVPIASAHADSAPPKPTADEQHAAQAEQTDRDDALAKAKPGFTTEAVATVFCHIDGKDPLSPRDNDDRAARQYGDAGIAAYWEAFKISPMIHQVDPAEAALFAVQSQGGPFGAPNNAKKADKLRQWRYDLCTNAEFRARWTAALRTAKEKYDQKLKPGMRSEAAMHELYDQKQLDMIKALDDEQARSGHAGPSVAKVVSDKLAVFAKEYDEENG